MSAAEAEVEAAEGTGEAAARSESEEEMFAEEGEPPRDDDEDWSSDDEAFNTSGTADPPAFTGWREQADRARQEREEAAMQDAQARAVHKAPLSERALADAAARMHASHGDRAAKLEAKRAALEKKRKEEAERSKGKKAAWGGKGGLVSRLYQPPARAARTDSEQGRADFNRSLRSNSSNKPRRPSASPRTPPRTLAVKPGSTRRAPASGGSSTLEQELATATGERDRLRTRLEKVSAELELAKGSQQEAATAQEALLEAQAELEVSRQQEQELEAAAKDLEKRLAAVLAAASAQGVDLSDIGEGAAPAPAPEEPEEEEQEEQEEGGEEGEEDGEELEIMCPDGAEAGDVITVSVDGDELELEIPEGVVAGETFSVRIE